jgi:hypothetical protein
MPATGGGAEKQISIADDRWTCGEEKSADKEKNVKPPSPLALKFLDALRDATIGSSTPRMHGCPTATHEEWMGECIKHGLVDRDKANAARALISKYRRELIGPNFIAANEKVAWTLK